MVVHQKLKEMHFSHTKAELTTIKDSRPHVCWMTTKNFCFWTYFGWLFYVFEGPLLRPSWWKLLSFKTAAKRQSITKKILKSLLSPREKMGSIFRLCREQMDLTLCAAVKYFSYFHERKRHSKPWLVTLELHEWSYERHIRKAKQRSSICYSSKAKNR